MVAVLKNKLNRGELLIGTIITLPSPEIAEIYSKSGFDWLFIDLEHSVLNLKDAQIILQAASPQTPCLVRVPNIDEVWIKKALDIGSSGIIVPQVKTAEEAQKVISLCKYPPDGLRSVGIARAHRYGESFLEYVAAANEDTAVIVQIEHIDAVKNIEDILKVAGIDGLFIGPYDLSASMGKIGLTDDPEVQDAIVQVKKRAEQVKIPLGIFSATIEAAIPYIQDGYKLLAVGIDTMLISHTAKNIIGSLRKYSKDGG